MDLDMDEFGNCILNNPQKSFTALNDAHPYQSPTNTHPQQHFTLSNRPQPSLPSILLNNLAALDRPPQLFATTIPKTPPQPSTTLENRSPRFSQPAPKIMKTKGQLLQTLPHSDTRASNAPSWGSFSMEALCTEVVGVVCRQSFNAPILQCQQTQKKPLHQSSSNPHGMIWYQPQKVMVCGMCYPPSCTMLFKLPYLRCGKCWSNWYWDKAI